MLRRLGGQLDHVAVRIAKIDRADELVLGDTARLDAARFPFRQHVAQHRCIDLERDMEIEVVLRLELERHVRGFEKGEERAVVETIERVQRGGLATALRFPDLERARERQPQEILIELPRLSRVAATICVVMQTLDHLRAPVFAPPKFCTRSPRCTRTFYHATRVSKRKRTICRPEKPLPRN